MKNLFDLRPTTSPVLDSLLSQKIISDQVQAIKTARTLAKTNPEIKMYQLPTGKFCISTQDLTYPVYDYLKASLTELRNDEFDTRELYFGGHK